MGLGYGEMFLRKGLMLGCSPLLTVLNRDGKSGVLEAPLRIVRIRGNIPTFGAHIALIGILVV